ncbi:hypothetical protein WR25_13110 [Diploscapter pachys]|uniref:Uncharacterized protein n=1 Tax=Diploscapter pachys TaxID=2018661 RepID=A0A2A2M2S0_9BILA|nr:hypothetical protein WR25_13110 [Diploscapter pachys]
MAVLIVKPGGTGRPIDAISARFAPLPPSRFLSPFPPSETPPPKRYTYWVIAGVGVWFLPLDFRKVGDGVDRRANTGEQRKARGALRRIGIVDGHTVKERIDRRAQRCEGRHRALEILGRHRSRGGGFGRFERGDEVSLCLFGRVGQRFRIPLGIGGVRFLLEDVGGALVASQEVGAVVGGDESLQRVDAGEQADEVVFLTSIAVDNLGGSYDVKPPAFLPRHDFKTIQ